MPTLLNVARLASESLSLQREKSLSSLIRPARLVLAVLGGLALLGVWQLVMMTPGRVQAARPFRPSLPGQVILAGTQAYSGTTYCDVVSGGPGPGCDYADLAVEKTVSDSTPEEGDTIVYVVTVTNHGPREVDLAELTDELPAGVTYITHSVSQGTYANNRWAVGRLADAAHATLTISATVDSDTCGMTITNTAHQLTSDQSDPNPNNNQASAVILVECLIGADLGVTKVVNDPTPAPGDVITYTVTVANHGPEDATGTWLTDTLPAGVIFGGYTASQGVYTDATGLWEINGLPVGAVAKLIITATVNSCLGMVSLTNTATATSDQLDRYTDNNEASAVVTPASAMYCMYLPVIYREPTICIPYDFNDSPEDWQVDDEDNVQTGYTEGDAEYFIKRGVKGIRIVQAPVDYSNQYTVEVDARWGNIGYEYGLVFRQGINADAFTYRFGIDIVNRRYRLVYGSNDSDWGCLGQPPDPSCWVEFDSTTLIHSGKGTNHLRVECNRSKTSVYINPEENPSALWQSNDYSCRGRVGVFAQSSDQDPNAQAYFANFTVTCPSGIVSSYAVQNNSTP